MSGNNSKSKLNSLSTSDKLAVERTKLANERAILAYIRSALTHFAAAASLVQFFENKVFRMTGYILIPLGFFLLVFGIYSYYKARRQMKEMLNER